MDWSDLLGAGGFDFDALESSPFQNFLGNISSGDILKGIGSLFVSDRTGNVNTNLLGLLGAGLGSAAGIFDPNIQKVGYTKPIPKLSAVRERVPMQIDPNRRPGSAGQQYFSDVVYTKRPDTDRPTFAQGQERALAQAQEIAARQQTPVVPAPTPQAAPQQPLETPAQFAQGGIAQLAKGRYLNGNTNGMADKVPANIEGKQPAALSHGEFVIPADVVSALGGGNSNAGAKELYSMMERIRQNATGRKEQMRKVNPGKVLPA